MIRKIQENILKTVALVLLSITGSSCSDWLTVVPDDGIYSQSYWKDMNDLQGALGGCYSAFARCTDKIFVLSEVRTDMVMKSIKSNGNMWNLKDGRIADNNTFVNWNEFYYTINLCNTVIKNGPKILESDKTVSPLELKSSLAEAYFLRSLAYFYLIRFFKEVPLITEPFENDGNTFYVPKSDEQTVLSAIIKDLEDNVQYANQNFTNSTLLNPVTTEDFYRAYYNFARVTKYAYWALMADLYLWTGQNQKCMDACDSVIISNRYRLLEDANIQRRLYGSTTVTTTWFQNFYTTLNFDEHIFTILYLNNTGTNNVARYVSPNGEYNLLANGSVLDELFVDKDDIRGNAATYLSSTYTIWKWAGQSEGSSSLMRDLNAVTDLRYPHWIIYRLADVILMKAEAAGELGDFTTTNELINTIRRRAGAVEYTEPATDIIVNEDRILLERTLELAYEGKHWFDLIRTAKRNNGARMSLITEAVMKSSDLSNAGTIMASVADSMGWYYPISKDELNKNKSLLQNPFYVH
jgi:starch-binding outer membrane protein, SusD/RagB family